MCLINNRTTAFCLIFKISVELFKQGGTKIDSFVYKIREAHTVAKQELAYHSKSSNRAQKLSIYFDLIVDQPEKQR